MSKKKIPIWLWLITSLLLMWVGFYNGFPITEGDTGSYIETGIRGIYPTDRTPFYGYFIGLSSLHTSLWFSVFMQSALLSFLMLRYIFYLKKDAYAWNTELAFVVVIISFTCVSWVSSYLMPDIFGGILLLAVLLYLVEQNPRISTQVLYILLIFLAVIIHNSHFLILSLFSLSLLGWAIFKKKTLLLKRSAALLAIAFLSWVTICGVNKIKGNGFVFSNASHVFFITKFVETGILNTYLHDHCGEKNMKLCAYTDRLPEYSWVFLWDESSPLYKTGGWEANRQEYNMIIRDVLTTPKYLKMYLQKAATGTLRELSAVYVPPRYTYQGGNASSHLMVQRYFPDAVKEFESSRQNANGLYAASLNFIYYLFLIVSSVIVIYHSKKIDNELLVIYNLIFVFLLFNAFVTSTFSTVTCRYQNRIFWILPLTNAIFIVNLFLKKAFTRAK